MMTETLAWDRKETIGTTPRRAMRLSYDPIELEEVDPSFLDAAGVKQGMFIEAEGDACAFRSKTGDLVGYGLLRPYPEPITHVAEASFVLGDSAHEYIPDLYYVIRDAILMEGTRLGYKRIQSHVFAGKKNDKYFAERLGFVSEGLLERYGPGGRSMYIMILEGFDG